MTNKCSKSTINRNLFRPTAHICLFMMAVADKVKVEIRLNHGLHRAQRVSWWQVKLSTAVNGTPSQSYGMSLATWDHTVLIVTKKSHPA